MNSYRFRFINALLVVCLTTPFTSAAEGAGAKHKVLFLAGHPSHGYGAHDHLAGCKLLAKSLNESGLPIEAKVLHYDWPKNPKVFDGVSCIVIYGDGGPNHMAIGHLDQLDTLAKKGVGIVCLHYAVEVPKGQAGEKLLDWIGGYFETNWSINPTWKAHFTTLPEHPITSGVKPFEIEDEWYYHMRFRDADSASGKSDTKISEGLTPILTALPPDYTLNRPDGPHEGNPAVRAAIKRKEPQHVAWAFERKDGGRGFGFTGAHYHWNWSDPNFRKLVLNAIVWCAKVDVPNNGVVDKSKTMTDMEANHDEPQPNDYDRESLRPKFHLPQD